MTGRSREHRCSFCYRDWRCFGCADSGDEPRPCEDCAAIFEAGRLAVIRADVALFVRQLTELVEDMENRERIFNATLYHSSSRRAQDLDVRAYTEVSTRLRHEAVQPRVIIEDCRAWLEATK